jgi:hypothetical protein
VGKSAAPDTLLMRLVRYNTPSRILPGMLDKSGALRDLSYVLVDILPENFGPVDLDILYSIEPNTLPPVDAAPAFGAPITELGQIFIGDAAVNGLEVIGPDADIPVAAGPLLAGIGHIVGAREWSGARAIVLTDPAAGWLALGPFLSTVNAVTDDLPQAATPGDLIFRGAEIARGQDEVTFAVDGLGQQRHACRSHP